MSQQKRRVSGVRSLKEQEKMNGKYKKGVIKQAV